jgi:hypothetical protein
VRFLDVAAPLHHQGNVVHMDRQTGIGLLNNRGQVGLDFRPNLHERLAERPRMLVGQDGRICVVVEQRLLHTPSDKHGLVGTKHDADQRLQWGRPFRGRSQYSLGPIAGANSSPHLATVDEETEHLLIRCY